MRWAFPLLAAAVLCGQQPLEIFSATYGAGGQAIDVTSRVRALVSNNTLVLTVDIPTLGTDPAPGIGKSLTVRYRLDGRDGEMIAHDFEQLRIPLSATPAPSSGFSISQLYANRPATPAAAPSSAAPQPGANITPVGQAGGLRIFYARYGADPNTRADVRERLRPYLQNDRLSLAVSRDSMGTDPGGSSRILEVIYEFRGRTFLKEIPEGATLTLP